MNERRKHKPKGSGLVFSTQFGKMCPQCEFPVADCNCRKEQVRVPVDGVVRLWRETKGRKGSGVTLLAGLPLSQDELKNLAKTFKQQCGSGGSVKNGIIEIQGDHRDVLEKELQGLGYKVKRVGG